MVLKSFSIKQINNEDAESNLRISRDEMYLFPNPAENNIIIRYFISSDEHVEISLYNVLGERISDFINKPELKGFYSIDVSLHSIPSGVYTCVMVTGENKKMVKKLVISTIRNFNHIKEATPEIQQRLLCICLSVIDL